MLPNVDPKRHTVQGQIFTPKNRDTPHCQQCNFALAHLTELTLCGTQVQNLSKQKKEAKTRCSRLPGWGGVLPTSA